MTGQFTLIGPFKQLVCLSDLPLKGALSDDKLDVIENGAILLREDRIHKVSSYAGLLSEAKALQAEIIEISGDAVCMPSFVDAHTHICFGGSRARDYALRNAGVSYLDIAKAGGGIWDTVQKTRAASSKLLLDGVKDRLDLLISKGITTVEAKSGYGLTVEDEIKMLEVIKKADSECPSDVISTCLAAHIKPKDFEGSHQDYLEHIAVNLFPVLKEKKLTNRIDAFVEEEAFSYDITKAYFLKAKEMGFELTVHADQFSTGGSALAVETGALSADHLEASTDNEVAMLAKSDVIAMALPGASIGLGCDFTPARKLLDAGAALAIASDWNPGSAPMGDLMVQACVLATFQKLSNAEVLAGITYRAAAALQLHDRGRIKEGLLADFLVYQTSDLNEVFYHQGMLLPSQVWKSGKRIK